ncbi:MAG: protein kinase domain-containing protein [Actinomycetota bacterium]
MVNSVPSQPQDRQRETVEGPFAEGVTLLTRYRLGEQIGHGGMGAVYRADDQVLERQVAIKILKPGLSDPSTIERFRREALIAASLSHPGIAHVLDFAEDGGRSFIVMELLEGQDLAKLLGEVGVLDPQRAAEIASHVADALGHAHSHGAVHRDVKPGNIFLTQSGAVKVTDFGIATAAEQAPLTKTGELIGTAFYLSPEQVRGRPATGASDIYALGCVLFEMLTARPPFFAQTSIATAMARLDGPVPAVSELSPGTPPELESVVTKAMAIEPEARFDSAEAMAEALRATAPAAGAGLTAPLPAASRTEVMPMGQIKAGATKLIEGAQVASLAPKVRGYLKGRFTPTDKTAQPKSKRLIIAIAVALILLFLLTRACGSKLGGNVVELPDLKSLTYSSAAKQITDLGLKPARGPDQLSTEAAGKVFIQQPPAGAKVAKGSTVTIGVSSGKGVSVPDLVNKSLDEAAKSLAANGLKGVIEQRVPGPQADLVTVQNPAAGALIAPEGSVRLTVTDQASSGRDGGDGEPGRPGKNGEKGKNGGHG